MMCSSSQHFRDYIGSSPEFLSENKVRKHEVPIRVYLYATGCYGIITLAVSVIWTGIDINIMQKPFTLAVSGTRAGHFKTIDTQPETVSGPEKWICNPFFTVSVHVQCDRLYINHTTHCS